MSRYKITQLSNGRRRVQTINDLPTRTDQSSKDECDVNRIIAKYKSTNQITHLNRANGVYADLSQINDYAQSLQKVIDANQAFETLPSEVRTRFANNPQLLLDFLGNPKNSDEAIKLGLINPPKTQETQQTKQTQTNQTPNSSTTQTN